MDENSGGTPNPLSTPPGSDDSILNANPAEPMQEVEEVDTVLEEAANMTERDTTSIAPEAIVSEVKATTVASKPIITPKPSPSETMTTPMSPEPAPKPGSSDPVITVESKPAESAVETVVSETIVAEVPKSQPTSDMVVDSLDPTGRTMERADIVTEAAPKKRTGLILGIIGGVLLICGVVAAVVAVLLFTNKPDPVTAAMQKIMSGEAPKNVAIDGDIDILVNNEDSPIQRINIDLDSNTVIGSMINTSSAVLTLTDWNNNDYSAEFEELYAANGDLYFKIEGATELLEDKDFLQLFVSSTNSSTTTNCIDDATGETNCVSTDCISTDCVTVESESTGVPPTSLLPSTMLNPIIEAIESADGIWLRMSTDQMESMGNSLPTSNMSCITNLVNDTNKSSNSAIQLYSKYPFITSSNKGVTISSKQNPVYQVSVDSENFTKYINAIQGTELGQSVASCMGWSNNASITEDDVTQVVNAMPKVYAEVNANNNFTRLYFESDISNGAATVTADLGFSYPTSVTVSEPVEYTDFQDLIQTIFTTMFNNVESNDATPSTSE
ncbi:hypothetical protein IKG60_01550 [Candidatus Saccharibacteria bacterium]|nr:hypothetical protein [Candidatus Saccharibacteria bacterium]